MQRPPAGGDQTPRQTDARCPNAPTFTGRDCHLQSSRNVVTLIRRAHAASAVFSSSLVTRTLHRVPSSTPRDRSHSTDLWQLIIVTTVHPLSRFNPGAPGAHCVHGLVAHLEPPLENHLNHLDLSWGGLFYLFVGKKIRQPFHRGALDGTF